MKKVYNIIPGDLIDDISIKDKIYSLIDSVQFDRWTEVNEKIYLTDFFHTDETYYVVYLDPVRIIRKLYITHRDDIVNFMKERINYEYGNGIDIAICRKDLSNIVICNHDGQIFILNF